MSEIGRANLRGGKSGGGFYAVSRNTEMEIVEAKSRKQTSSKREAGLTITSRSLNVLKKREKGLLILTRQFFFWGRYLPQ
jgi:hypothetical protein